MSIRYTNKKVRGVKRKCHLMVKNVATLTETFPEVDLEWGFWHMHLPIAEIFIDSAKTPPSVRQLCIQTLINRVEHLVKCKPGSDISIRVVASITLPRLWDSQIIVFFGDEYFCHFFERDNSYQKWSLLPEKRNIITERNLRIPEIFKTVGYKEELFDEDYTISNEIWFIGELD